MEYENLDICKKCGGQCCKKSGCDYYPSDFTSLDEEYLYNILKQEKISIVSSLSINKKNDKITIFPVLYLRSRNTNREIVDLLSLKTKCNQLKEDGCIYSFDERPSGGKNLIPKAKFECYNVDTDNMYEWLKYQSVLAKLVYRFTGKDIFTKLDHDIEKLFLDIIFKNFDYVHEKELEEIVPLLSILAVAKKDIYEKTLDKCKDSIKQKIKK